MYKTQFAVLKVGNDQQNKDARARLEELINVYGWHILQRDFMFYEQGDGGGFVYGIWLEKDEPEIIEQATSDNVADSAAEQAKRGRPAKVDA